MVLLERKKYTFYAPVSAHYYICIILLYFLQINTISSQLQKLYRDQNSPNIVDDCVAYPNHCLSSPCQNGAPCYNRKDSYYCDCTGMDYANIGQDVCARCKFNIKTIPHKGSCWGG